MKTDRQRFPGRDLAYAAAAVHGWSGFIVHGVVAAPDALARTDLGVAALRTLPAPAPPRHGAVDVPLVLGDTPTPTPSSPPTRRRRRRPTAAGETHVVTAVEG